MPQCLPSPIVATIGSAQEAKGSSDFGFWILDFGFSIEELNWFLGSAWEQMPRGSASRGEGKIGGRASGSVIPGSAWEQVKQQKGRSHSAFNSQEMAQLNLILP